MIMDNPCSGSHTSIGPNIVNYTFQDWLGYVSGSLIFQLLSLGALDLVLSSSPCIYGGYTEGFAQSSVYRPILRIRRVVGGLLSNCHLKMSEIVQILTGNFFCDTLYIIHSYITTAN